MSRIIHQKIIVNTTHEKVFTYFTENEKLENWLVEKADVVPEVGGKYELFWDIENRRKNSTVGCKITAINENKLLCFEWKGPMQFADIMNNADPLTHVTISFLPVEAKTEVHLIHSGWQSGEQWEEARAWFETVWKNAFKHLEKVINIKK